MCFSYFTKQKKHVNNDYHLDYQLRKLFNNSSMLE